MKALYAVSAAAVLSLALNVAFWRGRPSPYVAVANANSRPTYFSMHDIARAQQIATGRGVKIGIIDHYFGFDDHRALYAGGADFLGDPEAFGEIGEHGLWLTRTVKEIAPDAQVYALNATTRDDEKKVDAVVKAIQWAIEHDLDVLTYSSPPFRRDLRPRIDAAVEAATAAGVSCVFIHYPHRLNLLPFPMLPFKAEPDYDREPDLNVYHYDYNVLLVPQYNEYLRDPHKTPPYLSLSSTSVVVAGVMAMMREVDGTLSPAEYKNILIATSRPYQERPAAGVEKIRSCPRKLDAFAAVSRVRELRGIDK